MRKKTGLTLGKFAPFHKGHQHLIESALSQVDELYVLVYESSLTSIPLQVRARWIRSLYPQARVIEGWNSPEDEGHSEKVKKIQEDYILSLVGDKNITHFFSSEFYGEHVSKALSAVDCRVDEERGIVPISGTILRDCPYKGRDYLHDIVYRDLVTKVCFMGAPSTGKSTLTKALAKAFGTEYMPEYGAEYWLENQVDRRLTIHQLEEIPVEHNRREDSLVLASNRYLFCDTSPITTYVFAMDYIGKAGPVLTKLSNSAYERYDLFFVCDTDIPYDDTWDRSGFTKTLSMQNQIIQDLQERKIPFFLVKGSVEERVNFVSSVLARYDRYMSIVDLTLQLKAHGVI